MDKTQREFEIELACYREHSESFRSLNQHLWQIPVIAMTLTGGLWFGVANMDMVGKEWLLFLAGLSDIGLIVVLWRTRFIMQGILEKLKAFSEQHHVSGIGKHFWEKPRCVISVYSILLAIAGGISFAFFWKLLKVSWQCQ